MRQTTGLSSGLVAWSAALWQGARHRCHGLLLVTLLSMGMPALADQNHPDLDRLFDDLTAAEGAPEAAVLEARIWQHWMMAPTASSRELLADVEVSMRSGDLETALEQADKLVEDAPEFAEGWNKRATVRFMIGDNDGSVADITRVLALEPRHFGAISGLALIFLRQGDKAAALAAFEEVLAISPASQQAQQNAERVRRELESDI